MSAQNRSFRNSATMPSIINLSANERRLLPQVRLQTSFFAIFAYWLVFIIGVPWRTSGGWRNSSQFDSCGSTNCTSTELKAVDGIETPDWDAVRLQLVDKIGDESTTITVAPFGSDQRRDVKLDLRHWAFEPDKEDPVSSLGDSSSWAAN